MNMYIYIYIYITIGLDDVRDLQVCKIVTIDNPDAYLACQCCMAEEPIDGKPIIIYNRRNFLLFMFFWLVCIGTYIKQIL
jgi:hypothetical protein